MKTLRKPLLRRALWLGLLTPVLLNCLASSSQAANYRVGDIVSDFTLYARRQLTNDLGQIIPMGAPVRLTDLAGKIVFIEFFFQW